MNYRALSGCTLMAWTLFSTSCVFAEGARPLLEDVDFAEFFGAEFLFGRASVSHETDADRRSRECLRLLSRWKVFRKVLLVPFEVRVDLRIQCQDLRPIKAIGCLCHLIGAGMIEKATHCLVD